MSKLIETSYPRSQGPGQARSRKGDEEDAKGPIGRFEDSQRYGAFRASDPAERDCIQPKLNDPPFLVHGDSAGLWFCRPHHTSPSC